MSFPIFINELSYNPNIIIEDEAAQIANLLLEVLRIIRQTRRDVVVHSECTLSATEVGAGKTLIEIFRGDKFKEEWRLIRGLENRSPFDSSKLYENTDYVYGTRIAKGLGLAQSINTVAVSLNSEPWKVQYIELAKSKIIENTEGEVEVSTSNVSVRHISCKEHVETHRQWCSKYSENILSGDEIWELRANIFPNLRFLSRTENQIRSLLIGTQALKEVKLRLFELNESFSNWDPTSGDLPKFQSNVTPEHSTRKKLCWFTNSAGENKLFDWHARFTPGCGRIHFLMEYDTSCAIIGHVGEKL
ncbi:hypothetical protein [Methylobacterium sp. Leaf88]|uniref:hypothetical protein n=1 Tax=Methylobacterium sp. Leaf88 TaxID=1736244 RepID=UPI000AF4FA3C|nr:hypothetical protein [Methylobacterium sp. Leaf88]